MCANFGLHVSPELWLRLLSMQGVMVREAASPRPGRGAQMLCLHPPPQHTPSSPTHHARTVAARLTGATWSLLDMELKHSPAPPLASSTQGHFSGARKSCCICNAEKTFPSTAWSPRFLESIVHTLAIGCSFNPTTRGKHSTGTGLPVGQKLVHLLQHFPVAVQASHCISWGSICCKLIPKPLFLLTSSKTGPSKGYLQMAEHSFFKKKKYFNGKFQVY